MLYVLAASKHAGNLHKLVKFHEINNSTPNLQELSKRNMPKYPQKKPNQRPRTNKRNPVKDFGLDSNRNTPPGIPTNREDIESDS